MNCQEVMELMQRHVDKDLNDQETSLMMDHVGRCPECAAMLDRLVQLSRGLEQMPRVEPPYSLVDAILPKLAAYDLEAQPEEETTPAALNGRRIHRPRRAWVARVSSVVALGVVVAVFAINGPFFTGLGGSNAQKDAAQIAGSANVDESAAYSLKSEATSKDMRAADQFGKAIPSAEAPTSDQAPSEGSGQSLQNKSGGGSNSSMGDIETPVGGESADRMKGFDINPKDQADRPPMSIMEAAPEVEEAMSPDGEWKAVLTNGTLQIYRTADSSGAASYELAPAAGTRSGLAWQADSSALNYTYTDAEGNVHERSILIPEMKEIER